MTAGVRGTARCGTMPGYNAHYRNNEPPCGPCRACSQDWKRAYGVRARSGYRLSMTAALAELGLPPDRIPAQVTHA